MKKPIQKKFAVVLSGCGHKDGAEITEAVSVILALSESGSLYDFFAPDAQFKVHDPITARETNETRNVMLESARITRGAIQPLEKLKAEDFDGLVFPGGIGAARTLCNFAEAGAKGKVNASIQNVIMDFYEAQKPIVAICIAPALVAMVLGKRGVTLTLGELGEAATEAKKTGANLEACPVTDFITDREHKVISTPAYMYGSAKPFEVFTGIRKAVFEAVEMA